MSDKQNIDTPHERRPFKDHGHMDVVTLGDFTLGRGVFEPGWRWSNDVKPIAGTDSCQTHHTGICLSGQMTVRFDDGRRSPSAPATSWTSTPVTTRGPSATSPASCWTPASRRTPSPRNRSDGRAHARVGGHRRLRWAGPASTVGAPSAGSFGGRGPDRGARVRGLPHRPARRRGRPAAEAPGVVPGHEVVGEVVTAARGLAVRRATGSGSPGCAAPAARAATAGAARRTSARRRATPAGTPTAATPSTPSCRRRTPTALPDGIGRRRGRAAAVRRHHRLPGAAPRRAAAGRPARHLRLRRESAHLAAQVAIAQGAAVHVMTRAAAARGWRWSWARRRPATPTTPPPEPLDSAILFAPAGELVPVALRRAGPGRHARRRRHPPQRHPDAGLRAAPVPGAAAAQRHRQHARRRRGVPPAGRRARGAAAHGPYPFEAADQALADLRAGAFHRGRGGRDLVRLRRLGRIRSCGDLRLIALRFHCGELPEHSPDRLVGVRLVMAESEQVGPQCVTGHLEFVVGEMDGVHDTNLGLFSSFGPSRFRHSGTARRLRPSRTGRGAMPLSSAIRRDRRARRCAPAAARCRHT